MMVKPGIVLVALLVAVPIASAWHLSSLPDPGNNVVDVRNRVLATQTVNLDNAPAGNLLTYTFPWDPEYSYQDVGHTIRVRVSYTATFPSSSNGAWNVQVAKEATGNLASCAVRVETVDPVGISLDAFLVYAHYSWDCLFTVSDKVHYHYHTVYVNRTALSGSPSAMTAESVSVRLEAEDIVRVGNILENITEHRAHSIEVTMHENQFAGLGLDGAIFALLWLAALVYFLRLAKLLAAGACTFGFVGTILLQSADPTVGEGFTLIALLFLGMALWLESTMRDRIYQRWFTGEDKPGRDE